MGEIWGKVTLKGLKKTDEYDALFDSGATLSHLDRKVAEDIGLIMLPYEVKSKIADGTIKQDKVGIVFAAIDGCEWPILISVAEKGAVPVAIGLNAMQTMGISLDPEHENYSVKCRMLKS